jgi:hypothetical protein
MKSSPAAGAVFPSSPAHDVNTVAELKSMKELEVENAKLKRMYVELAIGWSWR